MFDFKFQISNFKFYFFELKIISIFLIVPILFTACSVPNLEKPECGASREAVKKFYSFHFGNDLEPNAENLKAREKFLSPKLFDELKNQSASKRDYFTQTDDYPKAFRVGGCEVVSGNQTVFEVLLFWKTETRTEQRAVRVETIKDNDKWLIEKVENKQ